MMAGGPLKPGVGLSGLVRLPEQSCPARCRVAQVRSSPLDATLGVTRGKKTLATAGTFPALQTWVCPRDIRGRATQTFHKIQLPERDRTDLNQSRTIVQAFFPV